MSQRPPDKLPEMAFSLFSFLLSPWIVRTLVIVQGVIFVIMALHISSFTSCQYTRLSRLESAENTF